VETTNVLESEPPKIIAVSCQIFGQRRHGKQYWGLGRLELWSQTMLRWALLAWGIMELINWAKLSKKHDINLSRLSRIEPRLSRRHICWVNTLRPTKLGYVTVSYHRLALFFRPLSLFFRLLLFFRLTWYITQFTSYLGNRVRARKLTFLATPYATACGPPPRKTMAIAKAPPLLGAYRERLFQTAP